MALSDSKSGYPSIENSVNIEYNEEIEPDKKREDIKKDPEVLTKLLMINYLHTKISQDFSNNLF